jgi:hypothetical protein
MRLPHVRFTVGRMMVAVVIVAVGVWGLVLVRRSAEYRRRTTYAEGRERALAALENVIHQTAVALELEAERIDHDRGRGLISEAGFRSAYGKPRDAVVAEMKEMAAKKAPEAARYSRVRRHWAYLTEKYRRIARYPFLPAAPDPPEPD